MCLITETDKSFIATEDITCYKILVLVKGQLLTPYKDFCFEVGKLYKDTAPETIVPFNNVYFVESGYFHAFLINPKNVRIWIRDSVKRKFPKEDRQVKVFKAIIPKGTPYFEGDSDDICAKSMKIIAEEDMNTPTAEAERVQAPPKSKRKYQMREDVARLYSMQYAH